MTHPLNFAISLHKLKIYYLIALSIFVSCSKSKDAIPAQTSDFCTSIHRNDSISLSEELKEYSDLMRTKTGVYVLEDGFLII